MNKAERIKFVQSELAKQGLYDGKIDGLMGMKTIMGLDNIHDVPGSWSDDRQITCFIQLMAKDNKIETGKLDGYWGPQTAYAYEELKQLKLFGEVSPIWRPEELVHANPNNWPSQANEQDLIDYYGEVGTNQTTIHLPYPHKLSWAKDKVVNKFSCHQKVQPSMQRVLTKVFDHYGIERIKELRLDLWGGCLNVRKMRGGSRYSMHSWGIALDYDPENNQLKWGRDRATFAQPEYNDWWQFWEEEGWVSLGRTRNFDWMHVQAAKL